MARELIENLSAREREVFELMCKGLSNADIGDALGVKLTTVKSHVTQILNKLEVTNRTEAVGLFHEASAPSEAPAIGVLPFICEGNDAERRTLAGGLADDLISRLSRRWFPVISRCSAFSLSGTPDAATAASALGAEMLVEGSLRELGTRLRLNVRLLEVKTGRVLWSDSYDTPSTNTFDVQDQVCGAILDAVCDSMILHLAKNQSHIPTPKLQPWQLAVRGMWHVWRGDAEGCNTALQLFDLALADDAALRLAHYGRVLVHQRALVEQWVEPVRALARLRETVARFLQIDDRDPWAMLADAYVHVYKGEPIIALARLEDCLQREPSSVRAYSLLGQVLAMDAQTVRARSCIERAMRLSPRGPELWSYECAMALTHFVDEAYEEAVRWATRSTRHQGAGALPFGVLAVSHAHMGNKVEAGEAFGRFHVLQPKFSEATFRPMISSTRPDIAARYLEGMRRAAAACA